MASVHEIGIASDTRQFDEGIRRGVIKPLENAEDAFKDLERAADGAGRDGARGIDKLEDALKDAQRESEKTARSMDDIGEVGGRSFRKLGDQGSEVSGELRQNLGETFSSFRGDLEDLPQIAQDTLGGLAGSGALGGLPGLFATAAGAAGIGLLIGAFDQVNEQQEKLRERANDLAQAYIEAGTTALDAMTIASRTGEILTDGETRKQAEDLAKAIGVDLSTAVRALAGDQNALDIANGLVSDSTEEWRGLMEKAGTDAYNLTTAEKARLDQLSDMRESTRELNGITESASETFRAQQDVLFGLINSAEGATKEVDELGNTLYSLPDGTQVLVEAKTGQATTDVNKFKGDLDGVPEAVTSRVKVEVDDRAWREWRPGTKVGRVDARVGGRTTLSWE